MGGMTPNDVYRLTGVADPRISPDGSAVAFVVWWIDEERNEYRSSIWLAPIDGSAPPRQLTSGEKRDANPRWAPDGHRLAFTSNRDGKTAQLYVMPLGEPGEPRRLTDLKEDAAQPVWAPDGSRLVIASRVPDPTLAEEDEKKRPPRRIKRLQYKLDDEGWTAGRPQHLFVAHADGPRKARQLTHGDFEDTGPAWSPDGSKIAFTSARHEDWDITSVTDVYVVDAGGGEPERITPMEGWSGSPAWSPDGERIAYYVTPGLHDEPRHGRVAVIDVATRARHVLTEGLDRNCTPFPEIREPIWDGEDVLFAVEDRGNVHVYRAAAGGDSSPAAVIEGELSVSGYDVHGGLTVSVRTTPVSLSVLCAGSIELIDVGTSFSKAHALVEPERFAAVSTDGSEVEAWIMRPAEFREGERYPLLLNIHGGPFTQYGNRFFDEFQIYAGAGYAVVYSNPRGSSGYSEEWGRAIRGPIEGGPGWGSVDYDDLMAVVDEAVKRFDFVDPDRLGVMGGSYGGYMTSWIVGHTDRFQCAVSERAVNEMISEDGSADFGGFLRDYTGAHSWEAPAEYLKVSPWSFGANITTPLLIIHSDDDLRCPVGQAEALFTLLRTLKRDVEFVRFPGEGHELSRSGSPVHRVMRFEIILEWLDRHLKSESGTGGDES